MDILLSTDDNYVMPTGILMHSIGINNEEKVCYHILINDGFSENSKCLLDEIAKQYNGTTSFYVVSDEITKDLPFGKSNMPKHVSIATYYRLFITKIIPSSVHKILYLDGDMLVMKSLKGLWETNIDGYALGAVHDMDEPMHLSDNRFPQLRGKGYFNAGLLLINLDYWREYHCYERFMKFIEVHYDSIIFHDQDVLNCVLFDEKKWVPLTYNFQNGFILADRYKRHDLRLTSEIDSCKYNPSIIHYTVDKKPWHISCFHPYRHLWRKYKALSCWKEKPLDEDKPSKLIHYVRNFLFRHNLYVPKYSREEYERLEF